MTDRNHSQNETRCCPLDAPPHPDPAELRRRAEQKAGALELQDLEALSPEEIRKVLYELQINRIQLEMQDQELCRA